MAMNRVSTLVLSDANSGDDLTICVRADIECIAIAASLKKNGDIEIFIDRTDLNALIRVLDDRSKHSVISFQDADAGGNVIAEVNHAENLTELTVKLDTERFTCCLKVGDVFELVKVLRGSCHPTENTPP